MSLLSVMIFTNLVFKTAAFGFMVIRMHVLFSLLRVWDCPHLTPVHVFLNFCRYYNYRAPGSDNFVIIDANCRHWPSVVIKTLANLSMLLTHTHLSELQCMQPGPGTSPLTLWNKSIYQSKISAYIFLWHTFGLPNLLRRSLWNIALGRPGLAPDGILLDSNWKPKSISDSKN
jgi:hypothetical protein